MRRERIYYWARVPNHLLLQDFDRPGKPEAYGQQDYAVKCPGESALAQYAVTCVALRLLAEPLGRSIGNVTSSHNALYVKYYSSMRVSLPTYRPSVTVRM